MSGTEAFVARVDKKGRIHLPMSLREELGIAEQVVVNQQNNELRVRALPKITNPITFLSGLCVKTKKTPVEMKRESEEVFLS